MPTELMHGQAVERINVMILFERDGVERLGELFSLSFSPHDESLYLRPIAPNSSYFFGAETVPAGTAEYTFDFRRAGSVELPAKLSVHASGQTHVKLDGGDGRAVAGPLHMPRLASMEDKHIATVWVDGFDALLAVERETTTEGVDVDFAFPFGSAEGGRVALYVNGTEPVFSDTEYFITLQRGEGRVLYVGLAGMPSGALGEGDPAGFTVLSGWNPFQDRLDVEQSFIYVRCL
jgi:hypothetical protein